MTKTVKVKAKKGFMTRKTNPTYSYRFETGKEYKIPEEHWKFLKEIDYLEEVKGKKKEVDE